MDKQLKHLLGGWCETCSAMNATLFCVAQGTGPSSAKC